MGQLDSPFLDTVFTAADRLSKALHVTKAELDAAISPASPAATPEP